MTEEDINGILDQLDTSHQIFWVTAYAPRKAWINPVNKLIHPAAKTPQHFACGRLVLLG